MAECEILLAYLFCHMIFMVLGPWLYWRALKYAMSRMAVWLLFVYPPGVAVGWALWVYCAVPWVSANTYLVPEYWLLTASLGSALTMWTIPSIVAWIVAVCLRLHRAQGSHVNK
jgi:hypothetical protein